MLMTIVLSLLAVWLTILIGCQLIGAFLGYKFFKMIAEDKQTTTKLLSISLEISTRIYLIKKTNRDKVVASDLTVILMTGLKSTLITSRLISIDQIGGFCTATTQTTKEGEQHDTNSSGRNSRFTNP